jgi:hypothetical protein
MKPAMPVLFGVPMPILANGNVRGSHHAFTVVEQLKAGLGYDIQIEVALVRLLTGDFWRIFAPKARLPAGLRVLTNSESNREGRGSLSGGRNH